MALDRQVILVVGLLGRTLLVDPVDRAGRSWNSARWRLKPVVFMLAMLFEMTSTLVCCASMPVEAMESERIIVPF